MKFTDQNSISTFASMKINSSVGALLVIFLFAFTRARSQHTSGFFFGAGTYGHYTSTIGQLSNRAWEFNNYTDVTKTMQAKNSFHGGGMGVVGILPINESGVGVLFSLAYFQAATKMDGTRSNGGNELSHNYQLRRRGIFYTIGIGTASTNRNGAIRKVTFGYLPYFALEKMRMKEKLIVGGEDQTDPYLYKGSYFVVRHTFYVNVRLSERIGIGFQPYYQATETAELVYDNPDLLILNTEYYNPRNIGLNLCLNYSF